MRDLIDVTPFGDRPGTAFVAAAPDTEARLRERRLAAWEQAKTLTEVAWAENRVFSEGENRWFDALLAEIADIDRKLDALNPVVANPRPVTACSYCRSAVAAGDLRCQVCGAPREAVS